MAFWNANKTHYPKIGKAEGHGHGHEGGDAYAPGQGAGPGAQEGDFVALETFHGHHEVARRV